MTSSNIMVVRLPCPPMAPVLTTHVPALDGATLAVSIDDRCEHWPLVVPQDLVDYQLDLLVSLQRPKAVVLCSKTPFSVEQVQSLTAAAFRGCNNVSIVGSFRRVHLGNQVIPIYIPMSARTFCFIDSAPGGSAHNHNLVVFGNMAKLKELNIHSECHVYMAGVLAPDIQVCIKARSLVVNGFVVPTKHEAATSTQVQSYQFSNAR